LDEEGGSHANCSAGRLERREAYTFRAKTQSGGHFSWAPAVIVAHRLVREFGMESTTAVVVAGRSGFLVERRP
jgi:hypothetical protein